MRVTWGSCMISIKLMCLMRLARIRGALMGGVMFSYVVDVKSFSISSPCRIFVVLLVVICSHCLPLSVIIVAAALLLVDIHYLSIVAEPSKRVLVHRHRSIFCLICLIDVLLIALGIITKLRYAYASSLIRCFFVFSSMCCLTMFFYVFLRVVVVYRWSSALLQA